MADAVADIYRDHDMLPDGAPPSLAMRSLGLAIVAGTPALFWTAAAFEIGRLLDAQPNAGALALLSVSIAMFLLAVCGPMMMRGLSPAPASRQADVSDWSEFNRPTCT